MKKVGIVSCYFKNNYGSMLQAYATQKILDNMNIENETINIKSLDNEIQKGKKKYYLGQIFNRDFLKSKLGMIKFKLYCKISKSDLSNNIKKRNFKFEEFRKKIRLSEPYVNFEELTKKCSNYTDVIVGSDQLWLPVNIVADYYTLNFVPDNINKISLSTSFGISKIPKKYEKDYQKFLTRIESISVREEEGKNIVKELTGSDCELICDPTLFFNKNEWREIQNENKIIEEKYILCYFLGSDITHRNFAERLKEKTGYNIVSLNHLDEYVKYSDKFADYAPYDIGPGEFMNLIRNAEYVCTDSFHGTIFSLINNKIFFNFKRYSDNVKVSTNSRINSLLNTVDLKNRLLSGNENVDEVLKLDINYEKVNGILEDLRIKSKEFLRKSLKV